VFFIQRAEEGHKKMTVALLVSMMVSFWMSEPTNLIPQNATGNLKQAVEKMQSFKLTPSCYLSFEKFTTPRTEWNANAQTGDSGDARAN
jgi:hypothetical protein